MALAHSYSSLKTFENCPKNFYHQRIAKDIKDAGGEASLYGDRIHKQLDERLRFQKELPSESAAYEPLCKGFEKLPGRLLSEQEMTLNQDLVPTGWWDADAWLRSKIDVLVMHKADALVADWKTGKRRPDTAQLELFALQVFKHYPEIARVRTTFVWLKEMKLDTQTYTRLDAPAMWQRIMGKISRIEQADKVGVWPAKPSGLCPWCPCKNICEFARV